MSGGSPAEQTPNQQPAVANGALPFQAAAGGAPAAAVAALVPGAGITLPRRAAPKQLGSPGALTPLCAFLGAAGPAPDSGARPASAAPTSGPDGALPFAAPRADAAEAAPTSAQASAPAGAPSAPGDSPWTRASAAPTGAADSGRASSMPNSGTGDPLAKSSPWLSSQSIAVDMLPSAQVDIPSAKPTDAKPVAPPEPPKSRTAMTILLAVLAVALIGAIAYVAVTAKKKSDDTVDVKAGQAQKQYEMDHPSAAPTVTASATAAPKPVYKPPPPPKKDIYDDL
jgi:hypothetical protein